MVDEIADLIAERALEKINERLVVLAVGALRQQGCCTAQSST
jgi:hypothetical protein